MKTKYSQEVVEYVVKNSYNYNQVLMNLGHKTVGSGSYTYIKKLIDYYKVSTEHFTSYYKSNKLSSELNTNNNNIGNQGKYIPAKKYLCKGSEIKSSNLKFKLYKENLKTPICEFCNQDDNWNDNKISLILDHINGDKTDNRLENLRILCPNCNSTLDTNSGKNKKQQCKNCNLMKVDLKIRKDKFCSDNCLNKYRISSLELKKTKNQSIYNLFTKSELQELLNKHSKTQICKDYRTCIKTLNKYIEKYQLTVVGHQRINLDMNLVLNFLKEGKSREEISRYFKISPSTLRVKINNYEKYGSQFKPTNRKRKEYFTQEQLIKKLPQAKNYSDLMKLLNINPKNHYARKKINEEVNVLTLDNNHFKTSQDLRKQLIGKIKTPIKDLLVENSSCSRSHLKQRLVKEGYKELKCEICNIDNNWNGKKMPMVLDHINGINNDNRLGNLQIICSNCNATLSTNCGKNKRFKMKNCGYQKCCNFTYKNKYCSGDCNLNQQKENSIKDLLTKPPYNELKNSIKRIGYTNTGILYNVSDNTVRKWIKRWQEYLNIKEEIKIDYTEYDHPLSIKLNKEVIEKLIEQGLDKNKICIILDCSRSTLNKYIRKYKL